MKNKTGKNISAEGDAGKFSPKDLPGGEQKASTSFGSAPRGSAGKTPLMDGKSIPGKPGNEGKTAPSTRELPGKSSQAMDQNTGIPPSGGKSPGGGSPGMGKGDSGFRSVVGNALKTTAGKVTLALVSLAVVTGLTLGGIALAKQASSVPAISGTWVFHTTETGECGHTYDGWTVPVWQKGNTFYGNEVPQPVIANGKLSGNTVTFSIIVYPEYDMGDGNFTDLEGTLEGNLITGTLSGHNGGNSCFWEGDFTVTIQD